MNMEQNIKGREGALMSRLCEKRVVREFSSDFLIPDTQPEARRILVVTERLLPSEKYVGASSVECSGVIDYRVIYLGVDGELWGVCFSSEFELEAPMDVRRPDTSGGVSAIVRAFCEGSSARVNAGRKLSIKSRIGADIWAYGEVGNAETTGVGEGDVESLLSTVSCTRFMSADSEILELTDEISGLSTDCRVISADAVTQVKDLRRGEDSLVVVGDITVKLLVSTEGRRVDTVMKKIPFEGVVELGGPVMGASCSADCYLTDLAVDLTEGRAELSLSATLLAYAAENIDISYLSDAYSTDRACDIELSELQLPVDGMLSVGNFTQSERLPLGETNIPDGARLIEIFPKVSFESCGYNGRYELTGKCRYILLWENEGEYGVSEIELPVRYETEGREAPSPVYSYGGEVVACRGRIDGELLCIDSEIVARLGSVGSQRVQTVSDISLGEKLVKDKNRMVVYFPADGETLWEVAKKYHVRADSLTEEKNYYMF